jgi:MFS family permease
MSTQDVAIDAYTVENLSERERGPGVSVKIIMEALGSMAAVAGLMAVQEYFGWRTSMVLCAGLLICFTLPVLLRPEPKRGPAEAKAPRPSLIKLALRKDSRLIVGLLLLAGLVKGGLASMTGAFLVDGGLGLAEIGIVTGVVFSTGQLLGAAAGGLAMQRFGARDYARNLAFLIIPGFAPMAALAWFGSPQLWSAALAMAPAAFALAGLHLLVTTSRLGWASRSQAGTDFSAQGAVYNMGESAMAAIAGAMALRLGWPGFFLAVAAIATSAAIAFFVSHARLRDLVDARERAVGEQS